MSSYVKYCREQAAKCGRRARLANSPEVVAHFRNLEARWLKFAEKAEAKNVGLTIAVRWPASFGTHRGAGSRPPKLTNPVAVYLR